MQPLELQGTVISGQRVYLFRKYHTFREKALYVFDSNSPDLTLLVNPIWYILKWIYVSINIGFTFSAVLVLLFTSFPSYIGPDGSDLSIPDKFNKFEIVCILFFIVDFVLRLLLNVERKIFFFKITSLIDFLMIIQFFITRILFHFGINTVFFRVFYTFRLFGVLLLSRYNSKMLLLINALKNSMDTIVLLVITAILIITVISTGFFFAEKGDFDPDLGLLLRKCPSPVVYHSSDINIINSSTTNGWLYKGSNCTNQPSPYQSIFEAMYWGVVMMTTTGYRVDAPVSDLGRALAIIASVFGILLFTVPASVLATNYRAARHNLENQTHTRHFERTLAAALKEQSNLRRDLERIWKLKVKSNLGVTIQTERQLFSVAHFYFEGVSRAIYEVIPQREYVYEPLAIIKRNNEGDVIYTDDFNLQTAQRVLTCYLVNDSEEARKAARRVLYEEGFLPIDAPPEFFFVGADPMVSINVSHIYASSYPNLSKIVYYDNISDISDQNSFPLEQSRNFVSTSPLRFVIDLPHLYGVSEVISFLECTSLHISISMPKTIYMLQIPLHVDHILASRLFHELFILAYERTSDKNLIAYIHPSDVADLLQGFCSQFIPTLSPDIVIMCPELVDQQVVAGLINSFPLIMIENIPIQGANSCYRSSHINIDSDDCYFLEVNLTQLGMLDKLGYGQRFKVNVPMCEKTVKEVTIPLK